MFKEETLSNVFIFLAKQNNINKEPKCITYDQLIKFLIKSKAEFTNQKLD